VIRLWEVNIHQTTRCCHSVGALTGYIDLYAQVCQDDQFLYLIMEYAGAGTLDSVITRGGLKEVDSRHVFAQLVSAVKYCHRHHIAHRYGDQLCVMGG
jgi:serine/threonine protein kinase